MSQEGNTMSEHIIDAQGLLCPKPLIMTKKALKEGLENFQVILDNKTAYENVMRFLTDNHVPFETDENGQTFTIRVTGTVKELKHSEAEDYCPMPAPNEKTSAVGSGTVFCFRTDKMGEGSDELGRILIQACCNTLGELDPLPSALVFYNSGINLALEGSPVLESLKTLEKSGVRILVCGTCADYFKAKEKVGAGIVSNMYDILECLSGASHVVSP